ncbi:hypothetical protein ACOSQ3_006905 [Xanthoceras sorbifolium]
MTGILLEEGGENREKKNEELRPRRRREDNSCSNSLKGRRIAAQKREGSEIEGEPWRERERLWAAKKREKERLLGD